MWRTKLELRESVMSISKDKPLFDMFISRFVNVRIAGRAVYCGASRGKASYWCVCVCVCDTDVCVCTKVSLATVIN